MPRSHQFRCALGGSLFAITGFIAAATVAAKPSVKDGGLANVSAALLKYLTAAGQDLRLFMPAHAVIDRPLSRKER